MKSEIFKFWMVLRSGGNSPTFRHPSKEAAIQEAERLATSAPGETFYVLKTTAALRATSNIERLKITPDDIPF